MVVFTTLLALIGIGLLGTAAVGVITGVDIPEVIAGLLEIFIPFVGFFFGFILFLVSNFWIVLGIIEIVIMGYSMGEREFMTMMKTFVTLNIQALMFFYDLIRRLFELVISFIKMIPLFG